MSCPIGVRAIAGRAGVAHLRAAGAQQARHEAVLAAEALDWGRCVSDACGCVARGAPREDIVHRAAHLAVQLVLVLFDGVPAARARGRTAWRTWLCTQLRTTESMIRGDCEQITIVSSL